MGAVVLEVLAISWVEPCRRNGQVLVGGLAPIESEMTQVDSEECDHHVGLTAPPSPYYYTGHTVKASSDSRGVMTAHVVRSEAHPAK
jgi:hypothetical protein